MCYKNSTAEKKLECWSELWSLIGLMIELSRAQIDGALSRLDDGVMRYTSLQARLPIVNVAADERYQTDYNYYYKVRRNRNWRGCYFDILETNKSRSVSFEEVLNEIYERTRCVEASFASKLVATINPDLPVIDHFSLKNSGLTLPDYTNKNRRAIIVSRYETLTQYVCTFERSMSGKYLRRQFAQRYGGRGITVTKMIDFVLWQIRE